MRTYYTWNTIKTGSRFTWNVKEVTTRTTANARGSYADTEIVKTGTRATHAQAKGLAEKWIRYLRAVAA